MKIKNKNNLNLRSVSLKKSLLYIILSLNEKSLLFDFFEKENYDRCEFHFQVSKIFSIEQVPSRDYNRTKIAKPYGDSTII